MLQNTNQVDVSKFLPSTPEKQKVSLDQPLTNKSIKDEEIDQILSQNYEIAKVAARDALNLGKAKTFGADIDHHQFERYYNHPKFKQLGFNPYLDNESRYNEVSSFSDDFRRTWGQWKVMAGSAFVDAAGFGPQSDVEQSKLMEKAMAIGSSTRGGVGGFINNTFLNSGYTFGIMGEIIAEEILMFGATVLTGGATAELAALRTAANVTKATKSFFKLSEWTAKANKIISALDNMRDVGVARSVYQSLATGGTSAGKYIAKTAMGETYNFLSNFNSLENLSGVAKTAKGFGSVYRDIRNVRLAYGESAVEAGSVENEMLHTLYDDFLAKNGREPNDEEIAKIQSTAKTAGLSTFWGNMPTIFVSNQIVLGNFMKSFSPLRKLMPIDEGRFFKTIVTKQGIKSVEKNLTNAAKALIKPRTYGAFALNYTAANLAEGLQESAQEVIAGANKQYYRNLYNNNTRGGYYDAIADSLSSQFSAEGLEIFASGFFMGGITSVAGGAFTQTKEQLSKFTDKNYAAKKEAARASSQQKAKVLDEFYKDPLKYNNLHLDNAVVQKNLQAKMKNAEESGDAKGFQDSKWQSMANQFWTVFETGMDKTFMQRYDDLQKLNDEELLEAVSGEDASTIRQNLAEMSAKMGEFRKGYDYVTKNLQNPFQPSAYKPNTPEYQNEAYGYLGFQSAQKDLVFMREGMKNTMKRMSSIVSEASSDIGVNGVNASDVVNLFNIKTLSAEITQLRKESALLDEQDLYTDEAKQLKKDKEERIKTLESFFSSMVGIISETSKNKEDKTFDETKDVISTKENKISASTYKKGLDAYSAYIKSIARGPVMNSNLENSFNKLIDHYLLDEDTTNYQNAINNLVNPGNFYEYARRKKEVIEAEHKDRKQRIDEALRSYQGIVDTNALLKELFNRNIFFNAEDWKSLKEEGKMPKRLYLMKASGNDQLLTTSSEYNEAILLIKEYLENSDIVLSDIPLDYNKLLDQYDTDVRDKLPGDNRSYEDIAEQYEFDPKARRTTLPLKDVLQNIIDSDYATDQERSLARRLMMMAKPDETVTFTNELAGPGAYTEAEQTVIDARYSSAEYSQNAQSYPIETSILREEVNRRIYGMLSEKGAFQESMNSLYRLGLEYYAEQQQLGLIDKMPLGLRALDDFIRETLTNESFRDFLHEIPFENTGKTAWSEFVDTVVDTLSVTEGEFSNSALNAVINVVTTKIDDAYSEGNAQASGRPSPTKKEVIDPKELSVEDIEAQHPELINELIDIYNNYNRAFEEIGDISKMYDADYSKKTPEEIKRSAQFRQFIKMQNPRIDAAFNKYFKTEGEVRTISRRPGVKETITDTDQTFLLEEDRQKLMELEYTEAEIDDMTVLEGLNIIYQGETKSETAARLQQERKDLEDDRAAERKKVIDSINSIENFNEFEIIEAEIIANNNPRFWSRTGFKAEEVSEMLNNKRKELAYKTEFDDINVGDSIVINNLEKNIKGVWEVVKKTKNQISLTNDKGGTYTLNRKNFKEDNDKRYIFKYNRNMKDEDLESQEINNDEKAVSNDDVKAIESLSDVDVVNAINEGLNMNPNDTEKDFLDSLDDIC